jgi:adenylylsulfate kinase
MSQNNINNVVYHQSLVRKEKREKLNNHRSKIIWFTGLSGSGKSTLSHAVEEELHNVGLRTYVLDGDNIRLGFSSDWTFSDTDLKENI